MRKLRVKIVTKFVTDEEKQEGQAQILIRVIHTNVLVNRVTKHFLFKNENLPFKAAWSQ